MADNYSQWYTTTMFTEAVAAADISTNQITFTRLIASQDKYNFADLPGLTNSILTTIKVNQEALISTVVINKNVATIGAVFTNNNVTADYLINTLLLEASYQGNKFLVAAEVANTPFRMPSQSTTEFTEHSVYAQIAVSNTAVVNLTVDPAALVNMAKLTAQLQPIIDKNAQQDVVIDALNKSLSRFVDVTSDQTIGGTKTFANKITGTIDNAITAKKISSETKNLADAGLLDMIWPLGRVYESTDPTEPSIVFGGGTWERLKGKVLVGVDENQTEFAKPSQVGGEKTHVLSVGELPVHNLHVIGDTWGAGSHTHTQDAHQHGYSFYDFDTTNLDGINVGYNQNENKRVAYGATDWRQPNIYGVGDHAHHLDFYTQNVGGGNPHNILQPYQTVYMWRRTA